MSRYRWPDTAPQAPRAVNIFHKFPTGIVSTSSYAGATVTLVNSANCLVANSTLRGGGLNLVTTGAQYDGANIQFFGSPLVVAAGKRIHIATRIYDAGTVANGILYFGMGLSDTIWRTGVPADAIYMLKAGGGATWAAYSANTAGTSLSATGLSTMVTATWYDLDIIVQPDNDDANAGTSRFYIDGSLINEFKYTGTAASSGLPSTTTFMTPTIEWKVDTAAAKTLTLAHLGIYQDE